MADPRKLLDELTLRRILASIPDLVFVIDGEARVLYANRDEAGIDVEGALGQPIYRYLPPEAVEEYRAALQTVLADGRPIEHEGAGIGADGRQRWYRSTLIPLDLAGDPEPSSGSTERVLSISSDITTRRQAQRSRERTEAILRAVGTSARLLLSTREWEDQVDLVLSRLGEATGVSRAYIFDVREEPVGVTLASQRFEWTAPGTRPEADNPELQDIPFREAGFRRWEEWLSRGDTLHGPVDELPPSEQPFLEAQGVRSILVVPVFVGDSWWGFLGFDDCHEARRWSVAEQEALRAAADTLGGAIRRERAEAGIALSEQHYRRLVQTSPYAIYALDQEGRFTELNRAGEELLGRSASQVLGEPFASLFSPEDLEAATSPFASLIEGNLSSVEVELRILDGEGRKRLIHVAATPILSDDEDIQGVHGIARDITQERSRELELRRAERLASLGTLIGGVAHELNNPLTAIRGLVQLLLDEPRSEDESEQLRTIAREADRSARIVGNLRLLARRSQEGPTPTTQVDMNDVVKHVVRVRDYSRRTGNIELTLDLADSLPLVAGNMGQLEQVVLNLLVNAEQALETVDANRNIIVRTRPGSRAVSVSIWDNGPGIPEEHMDRLFDPFWTTKDPDHGTGLGLSLVHNIVREHGGRVDVQSEVGRGALFIVRLPRSTEVVGSKVSRQESGEEIRAPANAAPLQILIVDDEDGIRQVLERLLVRAGHSVVLAREGGEALEAIQQAEDPFDLVFSDLRMPGVDGEELLRRIRTLAPELEQRLIFMTGDVTGREAGRIKGRTRIPLIRKPFDVSEILEMTRSVDPHSGRNSP